MLFRRRQPETRLQRMRSALWPRRSWRRSLRYMQKRVLRLRATPHAIAAGVAAGIFATFTPFLGFHFLLAFAIAYCIAGNMAAAALGCLAGNPLTFPFIWASTYEVGRWVLRAEVPNGEAPPGLQAALKGLDFAAIWQPYLKPMLVGSVPLGLVFGLLSYGLVRWGASSFQASRARRAQERAAARPPRSASIGSVRQDAA